MTHAAIKAIKSAVFSAMDVAKQEGIHAGMTHSEIVESLGDYADMPEGTSDADIAEFVRLWEAIDSRGTQRLVGCVAFTVGTVDRRYGGPEEGGWYYDAFTPMRTFVVRADREWRLRTLLGKWRERMNKGRRPLGSVLSDDRYTFHDGFEPATPRPHYE